MAEAVAANSLGAGRGKVENVEVRRIPKLFGHEMCQNAKGLDVEHLQDRRIP